VLLARLLGPRDFGVLSVGMAVASVASLVADFGVSHGAARFLAERRAVPSGLRQVVALALRVKTALSVASVAALWGLSLFAPDVFAEPEIGPVIRILALAVAGDSFMQFVAAAFQATGRIPAGLPMVLVKSTSEFVLTVTLVLAGTGVVGAALGRASGYVIGALVGLGTLFAVLPRVGTNGEEAHGFDPVSTRRLFTYSSAILAIDATMILFNQIDVLLVGALMGSASAGILAAPLRLTAFLQYPGLSLAAAIAPRLARAPDEQRPRADTLMAGLRAIALLQFAVLPPVLLWGEAIMRFALGSRFDDSGAVLSGLALYVFLLGFGPLVTMSVNYLGDAAKRVPIAIAVLTLNAAVDVALIPVIGLAAPILGTSLSYTLYVAAHVRLLERTLVLPLGSALGTVARAAAAAVLTTLLLFLFVGRAPQGPWLLAALLGAVGLYTAALLAVGERAPLRALEAFRERYRRR